MSENTSTFLIFLVTLWAKWLLMQEITRDLTDYRIGLRDKILETAMAAFEKKGVKAVKMDDIATALSISKRTLYEIYDDKEALLYEGISKRDRLRHDQIQSYASKGHNVMEILKEAYRVNSNASRNICPAFYEDIHRYPKIEQYMQKVRAQKCAEILDFMHLGVEQGFFRSDINYNLFLILCDSVADAIINNKLLSTYTMDELYYNFFLVPLRGVCTEKGLQLVAETWK